jgi:hypothetical protein
MHLEILHDPTFPHETSGPKLQTQSGPVINARNRAIAGHAGRKKNGAGKPDAALFHILVAY